MDDSKSSKYQSNDYTGDKKTDNKSTFSAMVFFERQKDETSVSKLSDFQRQLTNQTNYQNTP